MNLLDLCVRRKAYGDRLVLSDLQLTLKAGEVLSVVGSSGCGKSSLLRIVAGLDNDFDGHVLLGGSLLRGLSRDIGCVFQDPRLFPWLTVEQNVGFDRARHFDGPRVSALLAEVGLAGYERAWPKQLSGGQAQRVAIARALYTSPRLLLLDEPFSAVDAFTRIKLQELIIELAQTRGSSLLLVTHDIEEAVLLGDRVLVLQAAPSRPARNIDIPLARPRRRDLAGLQNLRSAVLDTMQA